MVWECEKCGEEFLTNEQCVKHEETCDGIARYKKTEKKNFKGWIIGAVIAGIIIIALIAINTIQVPYEVRVRHYGNQPYQTQESICVDTSWWSGKCIDWDTRTVTKYQYVDYYTTETKSTSLFNVLTGNVIYYREEII